MGVLYIWEGVIICSNHFLSFSFQAKPLFHEICAICSGKSTKQILADLQGTEADNEGTEEEGDYTSEYDQEDEDRENNFWDNEADNDTRDMDINPNMSSQLHIDA